MDVCVTPDSTANLSSSSNRDSYRDFAALIGHSAVKERTFTRVARGQFPPVVIFEGTKGVGKGLLASAVAAAFYCDTASACGECPGCRQVATGDHPELLTFYNRQGEDPPRLANDDAKAIQDFVALRPSQIGLSPQLQQRLAKLAPHQGLAKVVVVEDFDRLNAVAQNRLLKTLEEPPSYAHFILTTSEPEAILATIRSRAQTERVNALNIRETAQLLEQWRPVLAAEGDFALLERLLSRHPLPIGYAARLIADYGEDFLLALEELSHGIAHGSQLPARERVSLLRRIKDRKIPVLVLLQFFELELNLDFKRHAGAAGSLGQGPGPRSAAWVGRMLYRREALAAIRSAAGPTTNGQLVLENLLFGR